MSIWKNHKRGVWITKFYYQNCQYKKEGFQTRSEAQAWEVEKKKELKMPPKSEMIRLSFSQISTMYLEDCKARFQKNTWRQKAFVYRNFLTFFRADPFVDDLKKQDFTEYLKYRREAPENTEQSTDEKKRKMKHGNIVANRDLKELKSLFNWCVRNEIVLKNPCMNMECYPETTTQKYVPPAEDINKVLLVADKHDMDLIQVLYHTAARTSEILGLTWDDVNFEQRWIRLWTRKRRGGELQEDKLAMTDTLYNILMRKWNNRDKSSSYIFHNADGSKMTYQQKRSTMKQLCKKANVKTFGFHAIRHHVASLLADSGKASLSQIQKMLRHRRTTTTDNYIKTLDPQLRQIADVLEGQLKVVEKLKAVR
jgi:integrase